MKPIGIYPGYPGNMNTASTQEITPKVGICILNYHEPDVTLACVQRLLEVEGPEARILWLENDADKTLDRALAVLNASSLPWVRIDPEVDPLPPAGKVGFISIAENLGYAGGNNVGLEFFHRHGVEFAWVMNNDTLMAEGSSRDLVRAAEKDPGIGLWGTRIRADHIKMYYGGILQLRDFSIKYAIDPADLDRTRLTYISGCSMFLRTSLAKEVGWIPDDYFLYYEDPAFSLEIRKKGLRLGLCPEVEVFHLESLSTGNRSDMMEFYNRRNRWFFIHRYFPEYLANQMLKRWYHYQKWFFRGKFQRIRIEHLAMRDFANGRLGPTHRDFSRSGKPRKTLDSKA
jgi:GT2 family glycosyltransferase